MPIYEYVKQTKLSNGTDISGWSYRQWQQNNLSISLERGTRVLNLSYIDQDKTIIIPVLEKISMAYQEYSGRDREKGINQGIKYLEEQLAFVTNKSLLSISDLHNFSIKHGLGSQDGIPMPSNEPSV